MAHKYRSLIANKITQGLASRCKVPHPSKIIPHIQVDPKSSQSPELFIPLRKLNQLGVIESNNDRCGADVVECLETDSTVPGIYLNHKSDIAIHFKVDYLSLAKEVIQLATHRPDSFWRRGGLINLLPQERVVVEFSSPNIAKPFHVGHLRSTILGNFISNLHRALGHSATRINYLGDWGTQFGLLKLGFDSKEMTEKDLLDDPIKKLYDVYVWINKKAQEDESVGHRAREIFASMENGDKSMLTTWEMFRKLSIEELKNIYTRLNVDFDEYHGESMYSASQCQAVLDAMEQLGILHTLSDGRKVYHVNEQKKVTLVKSDGSSMYLTRDIAAAVDRYERYRFTRMYYVVDNGQTDHFVALFSILKDMGKDWAHSMKHIKFGRILGMSTRKGSAVFLQDLLDEAQKIMIENQKSSLTTKLEGDISSRMTADEVAVSAVLAGDMKQRRMKDYKFSWDKALQNRGDTGVKLQYVHCRLVSLEENCQAQLAEDINVSHLIEPQAQHLIREIARFDEILVETYHQLEPCILVNYLFRFCGIINGAIKVLQIKSAPAEIAEARLALFVAARNTLAAGMNVLGIKPLNKM